jgi:hypothetical protein
MDPIIVSSKEQNKDWRKLQDWYKTGKSNECEIYQRNMIELITSEICKKTNERLHIEDIELKTKTHPLKDEDGFEYTEDFDGLIEKSNIKYYFNLKMICDAGGAQTRTCREVYHFIKTQLKYIKKNNTENVYFINILDGDTSYKHMKQFHFLKNKYDTPFVFIGDMNEFQTWWLSKIQIS